LRFIEFGGDSPFPLGGVACGKQAPKIIPLALKGRRPFGRGKFTQGFPGTGKKVWNPFLVGILPYSKLRWLRRLGFPRKVSSNNFLNLGGRKGRLNRA